MQQRAGKGLVTRLAVIQVWDTEVGLLHDQLSCCGQQLLTIDKSLLSQGWQIKEQQANKPGYVYNETFSCITNLVLCSKSTGFHVGTMSLFGGLSPSTDESGINQFLDQLTGWDKPRVKTNWRSGINPVLKKSGLTNRVEQTAHAMDR